MKSYTFHTGTDDVVARYIFNTEKHRRLQSEKGWRCFYVNNRENTYLAFIWFHIAETTASSPLRASFGGFECHPGCTEDVFIEFVQFIENELKKDSVTELCIKQPPVVFTEYAFIGDVLLKKGYQSFEEIASVIPVTVNPYSTHAHSWEVRKLRQAKKEDLKFQLEFNLTQIYQFIEHCRSAKQYSLSLGFNDVAQLYTAFPNDVLLFGVRKDDQLAAACIALKVSKDVLYTFYYDHHAEYDSLSPVVLLMEGIYNYCQANRIQHLNLGTAMLDGKPNIPLLTFKKNLGGEPSSKITYRKSL